MKISGAPSRALVAFLCAILFFSPLLRAQFLRPISLDEKVQHASVIAEGRVTAQKSFWNAAHTMIFTSNMVDVYKVFKGSLQKSQMEVLTQGGSVGGESIEASDLLQLSVNDVGLFFCAPNALNIRSAASREILMQVYSSKQGFLKYDLHKGVAIAPFEKYSNITRQLYPLLQAKTGRNFQTLKSGFGVNAPAARQAETLAVGITSFSPTTVHAGALLDAANNVLTINGSGFGSAPSASAAVVFDGADDGAGGSYISVAYNSPLILSWTDTQIQVEVPTSAGTGLIGVTDDGGTTTFSSSDLTVLYSILTATFVSGGVTYIKESNLMDADGSGGYTIYYSTNTAGSGVDLSSSSAKATFQRALNTWKEMAGYHVTEGGTTTVQAVADDGVNTIMFDNSNTGVGPLAAGVLAVCYSFNSICGPLATSQAQKTGFDIVIRNSGFSSGSTSFTLGPCPPYSSSASDIDLESVLLHELGHSLNLGHINASWEGSSLPNVNPGMVMNWAIPNGVRRISPDYADLAGAIYSITPQGNSYGSCGLFTAEMTPLSTTSESKDACPLSFPGTTSVDTTVSFDLGHAIANPYEDPDYDQFNCSATGTSITNTAYYALKTSSSGGILSLSVSGYAVTPAAISSCTMAYAGVPVTGVELSLYQLSSCPGGASFPTPVACLSFSGDGALSDITGLAANTNYLLVADGIENTKASFSLSFAGSVLPLTLEDFYGTIKDRYNRLSWQIDPSGAVQAVYLEKSANGADFTNIGLVASGAFLIEHYDDWQPYTGLNDYRLRIVHTDGSIQYSQIVSLKRNDRFLASVFPNPARGVLHLQVSTEKGGDFFLSLYNSFGQRMLKKKVSVNGTLLSEDLDISRMASGVYRLSVYSAQGGLLQTLPVVIK